ncbi:MAG: hypothetical protein Q8R06_02940 [Polaromonas sp.]|uniref:hypothetical protein n=1 Tax=Polaromonas sp. TaxID=1869339 RepID=UPI0027375061|nr:hypothetical protein [Polaromonas sp.]MDP3796092.1 hypothetical protein [Polaromonas sp.]
MDIGFHIRRADSTKKGAAPMTLAEVDFGIVGDKKALPHAQDLAKAIEAAFGQAQALMAGTAPATTASGAPAVKTPVKTRKTAVVNVTNATRLEEPPSGKRSRRPDTVSIHTEPATK